MKLFIEDINEIGQHNLDLDAIDYASFEVRREWNNIDILVVSSKNEVLLVIENKVWSAESSYQLEKYRKTIDSEFHNFNKLYVFLTPYGDFSSDPDIWISYDYEKVLKKLEDVIAQYSSQLDKEVLIFIDNYARNIRRNIVGDKKLQDLCMEIYNQHKEAFDLIINNLPNQRNIYQNIIIEYLQNRNDIIMDDSGKTLIRFITKELDNVIPRSFAGWTKSGRVFLFEIENFDTYLKLKSVVGPSTNGERDALLKFMNQTIDKNLFRDLDIEKHSTKKYSHVNGELVIDKSKYDLRNETMTRELVYGKMDELFDTYISNVNAYLANFRYLGPAKD